MMKFQATGMVFLRLLVASAGIGGIANAGELTNPPRVVSPLSRTLYNKRRHLSEEQSLFCNFTLALLQAFIPPGLMECTCSHVGDVLDPNSTELSCKTCEFCQVNTNNCGIVDITNTQDNVAMLETDVVCTNFTSPTAGVECITTIDNTSTVGLDSCSVTYNGQPCKSCIIVNCTDDDQDVEYDCTNLGWVSSNDCDSNGGSGDIGALGAICKSGAGASHGSVAAVVLSGSVFGLLLSLLM